MPGLKGTLLLVAAFALAPAWLVGAAALGAVAGLWLAERCMHRRPHSGHTAKTPANVVAFRQQNDHRLFQ